MNKKPFDNWKTGICCHPHRITKPNRVAVFHDCMELHCKTVGGTHESTVNLVMLIDVVQANLHYIVCEGASPDKDRGIA